jgi:hypothetical protein
VARSFQKKDRFLPPIFAANISIVKHQKEIFAQDLADIFRHISIKKLVNFNQKIGVYDKNQIV